MITPSPVDAAKWLALAYIAAIALITVWRADSLDVLALGLLFIPWIAGPAVLAAMGAKASRTSVGAWAFLLLEALIIAYTAWTWYRLIFVDHDAQNGIAMAVFVPLYEYAASILFFVLAYLLGWRARDAWLRD